jgi:hypothetical protein
VSAVRDTNGRFVPGHSGGPGRPRRAVETDYLAALSEAVPMETWRTIVAKAVEQATAGDAKAREWLCSHLVGKPTGDALRKIAAAELAGFNPTEAEADALYEKMVLFPSLIQRKPQDANAHDDPA